MRCKLLAQISADPVSGGIEPIRAGRRPTLVVERIAPSRRSGNRVLLTFGASKSNVPEGARALMCAEAHALPLRAGAARDGEAGAALAIGAQPPDAQLHLAAERDARAVDVVP